MSTTYSFSRKKFKSLKRECKCGNAVKYYHLVNLDIFCKPEIKIK